MQSVTVYKADEVTQAITRNPGILLVLFGSPLASPCEFVRQELEMLANAYDRETITFAEVELPLQDFELIRTFKLEEVPTLILFAGNKEVERLERVLLPEELKELLDAAISFYGPEGAGRGPAGTRDEAKGP